MVARISKGSSLSTTLNYNEQKLRQNEAEIILAENYAKDMHLLNFREKLFVLEHRAKLNDRVKANSVHISLNFDPEEKLDKEQLQSVAKTYMGMIGFGDQPYLVYQHHDAGHPHLHIVTTNITRVGKRIDMNNIGRTLSEKARKSIDKEFKLISPETKKLIRQFKQKEGYELKPVNARKIQYGKAETKRSIQTVVEYVMNQYKFTSLGEFNAVLRLYNVTADPGQKNSLMAENKGLVYRVLDETGNKIGTPIKASAFYNKPTLKNLEIKFKQNEALRLPFAIYLKNRIDLAIIRKNTLEHLSKELQREGIGVIVRQNKDGRIYGITFIDYKNKCVFNGSDLGRKYSAAAIQERCHPVGEIMATEIQQLNHHLKSGNEENSTSRTINSTNIPQYELGSSHYHFILLEELVKQQLNTQSMPEELMEEQRRRKRKRQRL